jgi:hypothetical protein
MAPGPQAAANLQPVDTGEHDVEDQQIGPRHALNESRQRRFTAADARGFEPLKVEIAAQAIGQMLVVLDDQEADRVGCGFD